MFSKYSYKYANTEEIAQLAGISKGLLFHYFTNKRNLYTYINTYGMEVMSEELNNTHVHTTTDFFELLMQGQKMKFSLIHRKPAMCLFLIKAYFEHDCNVQGDVRVHYQNMIVASYSDILSGIDLYKFRDHVDVNTVLNLILWSAMGFLQTYEVDDIVPQLDEISDRFMDVLELMRQSFYKEEYL